MNLNWKKSDVARSFYQADKDGDGNLDLEEYVSMFQEMVYNHKVFCKKRMKTANKRN